MFCHFEMLDWPDLHIEKIGYNSFDNADALWRCSFTRDGAFLNLFIVF